MDDAIAVALKGGPHLVVRLGTKAPARIGAFRGLWRQDLALALFELFTDTDHTLLVKDHPTEKIHIIPCSPPKARRFTM
jgi:hypothetical protein